MRTTLNGFELAGTTTNRPDNCESGQPYFNETLAQQQVFDGSNWLTSITTTSAGVVTAATVTTLTTNAIIGGTLFMSIGSLPAAAAGNSGLLTISTAVGGSTSGNSGNLGLGSGDTTDGVSGTMTIATGDAAGGTNDSGDLNLDTGSSAGGSTGTIGLGLANATALTVGPAFNYALDAAGSDTYAITLDPALTQYITGQMFIVQVGTNNTGACSININALGAKNIKTVSGADPANSDLITTGVSILIYDGTNMVLINPATTCD